MPDEPEHALDRPKVGHFTLRDPRFSTAPMSPAEMKALHQAATHDEAFALLGQMQEERMRDGRIPQVLQPNDKPCLLDQFLRLDQQILLAMRPTPEQYAQLRQANSPDRATKQYMTERKAQNEQWFQHSRHWGRELERQAGHDDRIRSPGGIQAWHDTPHAQNRTDETRSFADQLAAACPTSDREPARDDTENTTPATREMTDRQQRRTPQAALRKTGDPGPVPDRDNER
jgi:hypothetical protein